MINTINSSSGQNKTFSGAGNWYVASVPIWSTATLTGIIVTAGSE